MEKTNAMRQLDRLKVPYTVHEYGGGALSGTEVAATIGQPPERVFKTLVTTGKSGNHYVFMVPVAEELDLKKAAVAVGEKSVAMLPQKELLPLTGYVHGGCSPIGMKKGFTTVVHVTAEQAETIYFSAGKIGLQIETAPSSLRKAVRLTFSDICKENEK
jgi:Cys-tRNA(Pro)/Cys-tRNA(Cys) deacylase